MKISFSIPLFIVAILLLTPSIANNITNNSGGWEFRHSLPVGMENHNFYESNDISTRGMTSDRFEVRQGDCGEATNGGWSDCENDRERSELMQIGELQYEGDRYLYSFNMLIPRNHVNIYPIKVSFLQFHQHGSHPVFMFQNHDGGLYLDVQTTGQTTEYHQLMTREEMIGQWVNIKIAAHWTREQDGFLRVYINDQLRAEYFGHTMTADSVYFKYGIYRSFMSRNPDMDHITHVAYFDEIYRYDLNY